MAAVPNVVYQVHAFPCLAVEWSNTRSLPAYAELAIVMYTDIERVAYDIVVHIFLVGFCERQEKESTHEQWRAPRRR